MREVVGQSVVGFIAAWACLPVLSVLLAVFRSRRKTGKRLSFGETLILVLLSSIAPAGALLYWTLYGMYWSVVWFLVGVATVVIAFRRP